MKRNNTIFNIILWVIMALIAIYLVYTASDLFYAEKEPLIPENMLNFTEKKPETVPEMTTVSTVPVTTVSTTTTKAETTKPESDEETSADEEAAEEDTDNGEGGE